MPIFFKTPHLWLTVIHHIVSNLNLDNHNNKSGLIWIIQQHRLGLNKLDIVKLPFILR